MTELGIDPRACALEILRRVFRRRLFLGEAAEGMGDRFDRLTPADRAFSMRLAETTIRNWGHLGRIRAQLLDRPLSRKALEAGHLISLGLAQILYLEIPSHAAVSTTVELAARHRRGRLRAFKGLINAVLRRAVDQRASLLAGAQESPAANLPDWLRARWITQFGEAMTADLAVAQSRPPPLDLTFKTKQAATRWIQENGGLSIVPGSVRIEGAGAVTGLPGYGDGAWWVQDVAASLPVRLIGDVRALDVLDLCAAPGSKSLQLAAAGGRVTAIDRSPRRLDRLRENLSRCRLEAEVFEADARDLKSKRRFDLVLLDAPCSASGTIRRHPELPWIREGFDLDALTGRQDALLEAAWARLKAGGRLVYCVCSLESEECTGRAEHFLARHAGAEIIAFEPPNGELPTDVITDRGELRTWPTMLAEQGGMDGFYAVCLGRKST